MKIILLVLTMLIGYQFIAEASIANRYAMYEGNKHRVEYDYEDSITIIPLTISPVKPHYLANINVYVQEDGKEDNLILETNGQYVPGGCFEDRVEIFVLRAYGKKNTHSNLNDIEAFYGQVEILEGEE